MGLKDIIISDLNRQQVMLWIFEVFPVVGNICEIFENIKIVSRVFLNI